MSLSSRGNGEPATTEQCNVRIPTGFLPLDRALRGGFWKGDGNLILGASGAGKSVVCSQFSFDMCYQDTGYTGLLIHTEMTKQDYLGRIISNKCQIPYARINEGFHRSLLTNAEQKERFDWLEGLLKRWQIRKWATRPGGALRTSLNDLIKRVQDEQGGLDHVHLDQLSGIVKPYFPPDFSNIRETYQEGAEIAAALAQEHHLAVVVYAQAHPENAINQQRVTPEMAAECKTLHVPMATAIGISGVLTSCENSFGNAATYEELQWLYLGKSRKSDGGLVPFRRRFDYMRLEQVDFYAELPLQ